MSTLESTEAVLASDLTQIGKFQFKIPKWGMRKQLAYHNVFLPLISGPVVAGLAYKNEDEEKQIAALISGLLDALSEANLVQIAEICLEGVGFKYEGKPMAMASIEALEQAGIDISEMYILLATIIKKNLGGLLKKDLLSSLMSTIGASAEESLSF